MAYWFSSFSKTHKLLPSQQLLRASPYWSLNVFVHFLYFGDKCNWYSTQSSLALCCAVTELLWVFLANRRPSRSIFSSSWSSALWLWGKYLLFVFVFWTHVSRMVFLEAPVTLARPNKARWQWQPLNCRSCHCDDRLSLGDGRYRYRLPRILRNILRK